MVVEVEGNIGSGKSTLTGLMSQYLNSELQDSSFSSVFGEKVNNRFLSAFYSKTKHYAFAFQMYMLTTRLYQIDEGSRQVEL